MALLYIQICVLSFIAGMCVGYHHRPRRDERL